MKLIPLTKGHQAIVDDEDYDALIQTKWVAYVSSTHKSQYARRSRDNAMMHRVILGLTDPTVQVDHINRNGLDNRRCNLRACTFSENMRNRSAGRNCKSGVRGVFFDKQPGNWRASIYKDKTAYYLGSFKTKEEAIAARLDAQKRLHGEFACS